MSFEATVVRVSHEGSVLATFEGAVPQLGQRVKDGKGETIGRIDSVIGPVSDPLTNIVILDPHLDPTTLVGTTLAFARRERRDSRNQDRGRGSNRNKQDWICKSCNNSNFAFRTECNRCGKSRSGGRDGGQRRNRDGDRSNQRFRRDDRRNSSRDGDRGNSRFRRDDRRNSGRDGDRGNSRFRRDDRRNSGRDRDRGSQRDDRRGRDRDNRGFRGDKSQDQSRDGDWECKGCGNNNFSFRTECNRCGKPKTGGGSGPKTVRRENNRREDRRPERRSGNRGDRRQNSGSRGSNNRGNSRGSRGSNNFRDRNRR